MENNDFDLSLPISKKYKIKCIVLGDHACGKTTMTNLFSNGRIDPMVTSTIGIGFSGKDIIVDEYPEQKFILQIWDTAGSERFRSIVKSYMRDVEICIYVYDITRRETFDNLEFWKELVDGQTKFKYIPINIILGLKTDLLYPQVSREEALEKADKFKAKLFTFSCVESNSYSMVNRMFHQIVTTYHKTILKSYNKGWSIPDHIYVKTEEEEMLESRRVLKDFCCYQ